MSEIEKLKLFKEKGFTYDPETGEFFRFAKINRKICDDGYLRLDININKVRYRTVAHRLAWFLYYGTIDEKLVIDHINRDKSDNTITNLRIVTQRQNCLNNIGEGVYFRKNRKKWIASIGYKRKRIHLGTFNNEEDAKEAYSKAKLYYF